MIAPTDPPGRPPRDAVPPGVAQAGELARELLAGEGTRLQHVTTAGAVAARIAVLFTPEDAELLVTAAVVHDIGYAARIARTGFHPLDGATFLQAQGYPQRVARLVAHHSLARMTARAHGIHDLSVRFPPEDSLLADALTYADMHSAPDGRLIPAERRLADIARRHPDRAHAARAAALRAAMARVDVALRMIGANDPGLLQIVDLRRTDRVAVVQQGPDPRTGE